MRPPVYGLIPAAGLSRRFPPHKLLMDLGGKTVLERVAGAVAASGVTAAVFVVGHRRERVEEVLRGFPGLIVFNPDYERGMGYSVARGVERIGSVFSPGDDAGVLLCPADESLITAALIDRVIAAYRESAGAVVIPVLAAGAGGKSGRRRGHPAVFPFGLLSRSLPAVRERGAREVIRTYPDRVREIEVAAVGFDIDTPDDYRKVKTILEEGG